MTIERRNSKSRFRKHGTGVYKCGDCGKLTRTVDANEGTSLCELCAVQSMCGNSLSDSGYNGPECPWGVFKKCTTVEECYRLLEELTPKG